MNAQSNAHRHAHRPKPTKLTSSPPLRPQLQHPLQEQNSPQQITPHLHLHYPYHPQMCVSHQTIYKSLYVQHRRELHRHLANPLRTHHTVRKPRLVVRERRHLIPNIVSIT